jgi:multidrug efflux pump
MEEIAKQELLPAWAISGRAHAAADPRRQHRTLRLRPRELLFLVLSAQYESWSLPLAIILIVPMCLLSDRRHLARRHGQQHLHPDRLVVLIGLAAKNAILIVEFAKAREDQGADRQTAALDACRLRLRPILMTSFAFGLGVLPLVTGAGAGAEMRNPLGVADFSGMLPAHKY